MCGALLVEMEKRMIRDLNFESERLVTARLQDDDADTLFQFYSDCEAMKYRGSQPMASIADGMEMVANQFSIEKQVSKLRLGIRTKTTNDLVGTLLLKRETNSPRRIEVGFSFGKQHWGLGYGQETLRMVEEGITAFVEVDELEAWCIKDNIASIRIFEKAGFIEFEQALVPQSIWFRKQLVKSDS